MSVSVCRGSRSSYFMLVVFDRHFGDICHVFECVDQSARSLAKALYNVTVTSRETITDGKRSLHTEKNQTSNANGENTTEKFVDDQNNNVVISMCVNCYQLKINRPLES